MKCRICQDRLYFVDGKGWCHDRRGSLFVMKCKDCGQIQTSITDDDNTRTNCWKCGSTNVADDHCAQPIPDGEREQVIV